MTAAGPSDKTAVQKVASSGSYATSRECSTPTARRSATFLDALPALFVATGYGSGLDRWGQLEPSVCAESRPGLGTERRIRITVHVFVTSDPTWDGYRGHSASCSNDPRPDGSKAIITRHCENPLMRERDSWRISAASNVRSQEVIFKPWRQENVRWASATNRTDSGWGSRVSKKTPGEPEYAKLPMSMPDGESAQR